MTRVVVVAGFLGSGKTSLILGLGRRWAATGRRIAVVENEIVSVQPPKLAPTTKLS
jgi:G3E family GTPase